jgi:CubicO group peptidase (beta-lactamase class C family)
MNPSLRLLQFTLTICLVLVTGIDLGSQTDRSGRGLSHAEPESLCLLSSQLAKIDGVVESAILKGEIPGAVVQVARNGRIGYLKAFGHRVLEPQPEPMTLDTIFDMASLTKVMATAPAVMLLVQDGKIRLDDRVRRYLPKFTGGGKDAITVRQLLTHFSGLRPDFDLSNPWNSYSAAMVELWKEETKSEPGKEFVYSDLNFITLCEIVRILTGTTLDRFVHDSIYAPLGMTDTTFNPPPGLRSRIAPTESRTRSLAYLKGEKTAEQSTQILRGEVHDPTAWRMGGVSGHAGLFSSARDIAIYAQMLLNGGTFRGERTFSRLTVRAMTTPQSPASARSLRGFGWDIRSRYSAPRGDLFLEGYGHTGFTGTSLWVHPPTQTFVAILTNRVHPDGKGDATHLRGAIANIVAASIVGYP